jgi:hypothetical protein
MGSVYAIFCWISSPDNLTAISTLTIAAFTIVLAIVGYCQARLIRQSINLAREEFNATQRPKLVVRELLLFTPNPSRVTAEIQYAIANSGAGRAEIVESHIELTMIEDAILRPLQPIEGANPVGSVTLEPGEHIFRESGSTIGFAEFTNEMNRQFYTPDDSTKLIFRGFIIYADKNRLKRRMAFCREYKFKTRRFCIMDDPDYEYAD